MYNIQNKYPKKNVYLINKHILLNKIKNNTRSRKRSEAIIFGNLFNIIIDKINYSEA